MKCKEGRKDRFFLYNFLHLWGKWMRLCWKITHLKSYFSTIVAFYENNNISRINICVKIKFFIKQEGNAATKIWEMKSAYGCQRMCQGSREYFITFMLFPLILVQLILKNYKLWKNLFRVSPPLIWEEKWKIIRTRLYILIISHSPSYSHTRLNIKIWDWIKFPCAPLFLLQRIK